MNEPDDNSYFSALFEVSDELRDAMVGLQSAIERLDAALLRHRSLKEARNATK